MLPTMSKIQETIVADQLDKFLKINNILPGTQSGFRHNNNSAAKLYFSLRTIVVRPYYKKESPILVNHANTWNSNTLYIKFIYYVGIGNDAIANNSLLIVSKKLLLGNLRHATDYHITREWSRVVSAYF